MYKVNKFIHYRQLSRLKFALSQGLNLQDNLEVIAKYNFFEEVKSALEKGASASFDGFKCLMVAMRSNSLETCAILLSSLSEEELLHFTVLITQKTAEVSYALDAEKLSVYLNLTKCYRLIEFRDTQHLEIILRFYQNWLRDSLSLAYKNSDLEKIKDISESISCVFDTENTIKIKLLSCVQLRYDVAFNRFFGDIEKALYHNPKLTKLSLETLEEVLNWCIIKNKVQYFNQLTLSFHVKLAALMPLTVTNNHTELFFSIFNILSETDKIEYVPYLHQSFLESAFFGRYEIFQMLIYNKFVDIKTKNGQGRNVLHLSVIMDRVNFVEILLDEKTDDRFESLVDNKNFLNSQDNDKRTALHYAILYKSIPLMKLLFKQKVDLNIEDLNNDTAMSVAIDTHQFIAVHLLLHEGALITKKAWLQALMRQEYSILEMLAKRNNQPTESNSINQKSLKLDHISGHEIYEALTASQIPLSNLMIQFLKEQKVNFSKLSCERTAKNLLHYACGSSSPAVVEALLNNIDVNAVIQNSKQSALHIAVIAKRPAVIQLLLNAGADTNLKDSFGYSAIDYANQSRDVSVIQYFNLSPVPLSKIVCSDAKSSEDAQSSEPDDEKRIREALVLG